MLKHERAMQMKRVSCCRRLDAFFLFCYSSVVLLAIVSWLKHHARCLLCANAFAPTCTNTHKTQYAIRTLPLAEPKFLVAQHNLATRPAILYWYDLPAMLAVAGIPFPVRNDKQELLLVTQVRDDVDDDDTYATTTTATAIAPTNTTDNHGASWQHPWPVQPTADKVGEFKVTPAVHVGYAATWYGLCVAGLYMTRMLLTRGRS
jgi:cytochrome oxidase assembly protein ShyY1